jgi:hypothetical protein
MGELCTTNDQDLCRSVGLPMFILFVSFKLYTEVFYHWAMVTSQEQNLLLPQTLRNIIDDQIWNDRKVVHLCPSSSNKISVNRLAQYLRREILTGHSTSKDWWIVALLHSLLPASELSTANLYTRKYTANVWLMSSSTQTPHENILNNVMKSGLEVVVM